MTLTFIQRFTFSRLAENVSFSEELPSQVAVHPAVVPQTGLSGKIFGDDAEAFGSEPCSGAGDPPASLFHRTMHVSVDNGRHRRCCRAHQALLFTHESMLPVPETA